MKELFKSELIPALPELRACYGRDIGLKMLAAYDNDKILQILCWCCLVLFALFFCAPVNMPLLMREFGSSLTLVLVQCTLLLLVVRFFCQARPIRRFAKQVNRLDALLIQHGFSNGIAGLCTRAFLAEIVPLVEGKVVLIRKLENSRVQDDNMKAELIRTQVREFASLLRNEFSLDVGPFGPMFQEADEVIAKEKRGDGAISVTS